MISASNICLAYGKRTIFNNVNIKFTPGNCYGLIGANGAGKSTFLKILAGTSEPDKGEVTIGKGLRLAVLRQDQFAFDEETVFNTVIMGHQRLYEVMTEREEIYSKGEFSEEDGVRSGELEAEFAEMNGYEAESEAAALNNSLIEFSGVILFTSHDHKFVATLANRVVELTPGGVIDQVMGFDEYLASAEIDALREQLCSGVNDRAA